MSFTTPLCLLCLRSYGRGEQAGSASGGAWTNQLAGELQQRGQAAAHADGDDAVAERHGADRLGGQKGSSARVNDAAVQNRRLFLLLLLLLRPPASACVGIRSKVSSRLRLLGGAALHLSARALPLAAYCSGLRHLC